MALKKQHISLFSDNVQVLDYTNMLRNCVKDITETTMVIPHLNEKGLIDSKLDSLNKKMNDL